MTRKQLNKIERECREYAKAELKKATGKEFSDEDVDLVQSICMAILDLRERYEIGNFDTRDCADEINAVMPKVYAILGQHDLYSDYKVVD